MPGIRRLAHLLSIPWTRGRLPGRIVVVIGLIVLWQLALIALAVAIVHDVVFAADRSRRLSGVARWCVASLVVVLAVGPLPSLPSPSVSVPARDAAAAPITTGGSFSSPSADRTGQPRSMAPSSPPAVQPTSSSTPELVLGHAPTGATEAASVIRVVDGDTIVVDRGRGEERVRYIGIDTPETVDPRTPVEWMGKEASAANAALVEGREVLLERDVSEVDQFDRLLRYVWVADGSSASGWLLVNLALVAGGYAEAVTYPPDVRYVDVYLEAQGKARDAASGLWGQEPVATPLVTATPKATPKPTPKPTPTPKLTLAPTPTPRRTAAPTNCHPSYEGVCLKQGAGDYDCAGGSGNGPNYVAGPVRVVGPDEFGLDGNDNDGIGCE